MPSGKITLKHFIESLKNGTNPLNGILQWMNLLNISKIYLVLFDYSNGFDSVNHKALCLKIAKLGLNSKLKNVIKSMYGHVKYYGQISEAFWYKSGLIQGEALSPFLFSLFVNDLEMILINTTDKLYQLNILNICLIMYADETVLFSESASELQNMLDHNFR